jgi:hypothetical protein
MHPATLIWRTPAPNSTSGPHVASVLLDQARHARHAYMPASAPASPTHGMHAPEPMSPVATHAAKSVICFAVHAEACGRGGAQRGEYVATLAGVHALASTPRPYAPSGGASASSTPPSPAPEKAAPFDELPLQAAAAATATSGGSASAKERAALLRGGLSE